MIKVTVVGDISFSGIEDFRFGDSVEQYFTDSDLVVGNLEAPLTSSNKRIRHKTYYLKADTTKSMLLNHFGALSLANNHMLDFGVNGVSDTIRELRKVSKGYFGVGRTNGEALQPYMSEIKGIKLAFFGASYPFLAYQGRRWRTAGIRSSFLLRRIKEYKRMGYFVIMLPHWGIEHLAYPSPEQRRLARKYVEAGCDVVLGSHPHEMQGIEEIDDKLVCYSLGNFIFSSRDFKNHANPQLYQSFIIHLEINENHAYRYKIVPYKTSDTVVDIALGELDYQINARLRDISDKLKLKDNEYARVFHDAMYKYSKSVSSQDSHVKADNSLVRNLWKASKRKFLMLMNMDLRYLPVYWQIILKDMRIIKWG